MGFMKSTHLLKKVNKFNKKLKNKYCNRSVTIANDVHVFFLSPFENCFRKFFVIISELLNQIVNLLTKSVLVVCGFLKDFQNND